MSCLPWDQLTITEPGDVTGKHFRTVSKSTERFFFHLFPLPILSQESSEVGDNFSLLEHFLSGKSFLDLGWVTVMVLATLDLFYKYICSQVMKEMSMFTVALSVLVCGSLSVSRDCSPLGFGLGFSDPTFLGSHSQSQGATVFSLVFFFKHIGFSEFYLSVHFIALVALSDEVWVYVK